MKKPDSKQVRDLVGEIVDDALCELQVLTELSDSLREYEIKNWLEGNIKCQ